MRTPILALVAATALTACGGTGTPVVTNDPTPADRLSFTEIADISADIFDGLEDETATPKNFVPTAGRATYAGAVGGDLSVDGNTTDIAAVMEMDVDFATDRVGGLIGNFVTRAGDDIDGTLALRGGNLNRVSNSREVAIFSDVDGTLRSAAGERIDVDARLVGGFAGDNVEYVGATIDGDIFVDGRRGVIDAATQLER